MSEKDKHQIEFLGNSQEIRGGHKNINPNPSESGTVEIYAIPARIVDKKNRVQVAYTYNISADGTVINQVNTFTIMEGVIHFLHTESGQIGVNGKIITDQDENGNEISVLRFDRFLPREK